MNEPRYIVVFGTRIFFAATLTEACDRRIAIGGGRIYEPLGMNMAARIMADGSQLVGCHHAPEAGHDRPAKEGTT